MSVASQTLRPATVPVPTTRPESRPAELKSAFPSTRALSITGPSATPDPSTTQPLTLDPTKDVGLLTYKGEVRIPVTSPDPDRDAISASKTGTFTAVYQTGLNGWQGITWDQTTGKFYLMNQSNPDLYELDPGTGQTTLIGDWSRCSASKCLAASPGPAPRSLTTWKDS